MKKYIGLQYTKKVMKKLLLSGFEDRTFLSMRLELL